MIKGFKNDLMKIEYRTITIITEVHAREEKKKQTNTPKQLQTQYHNGFNLEIRKGNRSLTNKLQLPQMK